MSKIDLTSLIRINRVSCNFFTLRKTKKINVRISKKYELWILGVFTRGSENFENHMYGADT